MITIIFETHATSLDNEAGVVSGHYDTDLSTLGEEQARELGARYRDKKLSAVFCSDLKRSYETAAIAFADSQEPIFTDSRLREVDYGFFTRHPQREVEPKKVAYVTKPFPNGESYEAAARRVKSFLQDLLARHDGETVLVIGHRATQSALEPWVNGVPLAEAVAASWQWQAGWRYEVR